MIAFLKCVACGAEYPPHTLMNLCPVDGRPVEIINDLERLASEQPDCGWYRPERNDMWRFGGLLPLDIENPEQRDLITTLGEGHTPLLEHHDHPMARAAGFRLWVKEEGKARRGFGANPTQSFKDRGMAMTVSMARLHGLRRLAVPTQGNAGDSLCEYARAGGLGAVVAMPDDTPLPIQGRVALMAQDLDNFHLVKVSGTIREAGKVLQRDWIDQGWFSVATFQEPGWRIEGKKTLGLELAEPSSPGRPWALPDVVIYPTGGGTGVLGMWKAWSELECLGLIGPERPRIVCIQSAATAPLVEAFASGAPDSSPVRAGKTRAYGLNVPGGLGHARVLQIIRESRGAALAVPEADMESALVENWQTKRWWMGPEGAACLAALPRLVDSGLICKGDRVVAFNTGSLEKYLPELRQLL